MEAQKMAGLPVLDMTVVNEIKKLMDKIRDKIDPGSSMDDIADLVYDHKLAKMEAYKPLLNSICDLLREQGYPSTADFFFKHWKL